MPAHLYGAMAPRHRSLTKDLKSGGLAEFNQALRSSAKTVTYVNGNDRLQLSRPRGTP